MLLLILLCHLLMNHFIHIDTYYLIIVAQSTYFDVLIVLLDYSHNKQTSSHYLIFYLIFYMYTLIFVYFIFHDLVDYIRWIFYLLEYVDSSMLYDYSTHPDKCTF